MEGSTEQIFFDLEAVLAILRSIASFWRVHAQLVSSFFLCGVPWGGTACQCCHTGEQGAGGLHGTWSSLLFCNIVPYKSAVIPFTFSNVFLTCGLIRWQKVSVALRFIPVGCCSHRWQVWVLTVSIVLMDMDSHGWTTPSGSLVKN